MAGSENGSNSARSKADCANCKANHYGVASNMPPSVPIRRVDLIDIESLGIGPTAFCRCYKSKTFPLCDGAHNAHNAETGDNAGPVVIKPMPDADVNREFLSETTQEEKLRLPPGSKRANNYGVVSTMPPDAPSRRVDMIDSALAVSRADAEGELRLCRCYKSAIFPLCDGSHQVHNRDTGDNTGPIVLKRGVGVDVANITKAANEPTPRSTPKSTPRSTPRSTLKPTSEPKKPAVLRTISMAEVATHNTPTDLWTVIHGKVYDLSDFVQSHPGGAAVLRMYAGKVADEGFDGVHTEEVIMQNLPAEKLVGLISAGEMQSGTAAAVTAPDIDLCLNLYDFEAVAKRVMKDSSFAYYATGATDEFTKQGNQAIFRRIKLVPTVMVDVSNVSLETTMLGARMSFPVYISGAAKGGLAHADGEVALARAAHTAGVVQMAPHMATRPLREIAAVRTIAQTQFLQLYVEKDRAATARTVREAEELGFKALFITVDSAGIGKRETDLRLTPGGSAPRSVASKRRWADDLSWADLPWLRSLTNLKLVLKGVQSGADAVRAYRAGVDGIVVSNHGGRNLDTARPALEALVEVMDALKREGYVPSQPDGTPGSARATSGTSNRLGCLRKCLGRPVGRASFEVFVDGGVYRGSDVYKALALGARAVGVGRAVLWGLAGYGQQGAERVLEMLYNELHTTMMFMGKRSLAEVDETSLSGVREAMLANAWSATRENLTSISSSEQPDTHR